MLVATCARIQWVVIDGTLLRTDTGAELDLKIDPPAVIERNVREAVVRWRWRNIEKSFPELAVNRTGRGAMMQPIWSLLKSERDDLE